MVSAAPLCSGYWGKLPAHGDFVGQGLPADWVDDWHDWWQRAMGRWAAAQGKAALNVALAAMPVWCLQVSDAAAAGVSWCGVVAPSQDRVGRRFPLLLLQAWPAAAVQDPAEVHLHLLDLSRLLDRAAGPDAAAQLAQALQAVEPPPTQRLYSPWRQDRAVLDAANPVDAAFLETCPGLMSQWWPLVPADGVVHRHAQEWPPQAHFLDTLLRAPA